MFDSVTHPAKVWRPGRAFNPAHSVLGGVPRSCLPQERVTGEQAGPIHCLSGRRLFALFVGYYCVPNICVVVKSTHDSIGLTEHRFLLITIKQQAGGVQSGTGSVQGYVFVFVFAVFVSFLRRNCGFRSVFIWLAAQVRQAVVQLVPVCHGRQGWCVRLISLSGTVDLVLGLRRARTPCPRIITIVS